MTSKSKEIRLRGHINDSKAKRKTGEWYSNAYRNKKIRKLLRNNVAFGIDILLEFDDFQECCDAEVDYIRWCKDLGFSLTNTALGGRSGVPMTDETKEKLRQANLGSKNPMYGRIPTQESREAQRTKMKGKIPAHYLDPIRKASAIAKGKTNRGSVAGVLNPNYGNQGPKSKLSKVLLQITLDGQIVSRHKGLKEMAKTQGYNERCIRKVITGDRKSYRGFFWKYE